LHLDLGLGGVGLAPELGDLGLERLTLTAAETGLEFFGDRGDEWFEALDHERAPAGLGIDEPASDQQPHRIADGVPGHVVLLHELTFGRKLSARRELARFDLSP
jgi:hypothetical protein